MKITLMEFNDQLNRKTEAHYFFGNQATKLKADDHTNSVTKIKTHQKPLHQRSSTGTARIKMNVQQ